MHDQLLAEADLLPILLSYLPTDRRHALATGKVLPERTYGAALFADISGFTPLTEALTAALGPRRGAEELTAQINRVYDALTAEVERYGGSVIDFAGDAVICWFNEGNFERSMPDADLEPRDARSLDLKPPVGAALRATACAQAMQRAMRQFASVPIGGGVYLAMKTAVSAGAVRRFVVGDPQVQLLDVLAGATLDRLASAEHHAGKGEIALDGQTVAGLAGKIQITEWRRDRSSGAVAGQEIAILRDLSTAVPPQPWPALPPHTLAADRLRPWMLPSVYRRLRRGQGSFMAELRPTVALFLRFSGIDYDDDPDARARLDAFVRWVQSIVVRYDGTLLQITIGDKGSYLYCTFGAPIAHEDDVLRALYTACELLVLPPELSFIQGIQIGVSRGQMRTGDYGGAARRSYGVFGNEVNVAARLMMRAQEGHILVSSKVAEAVSAEFDLRALAPLALKGLAKPLQVYEVHAHQRQPGSRAAREPASIFGRAAERAALSARLDQLRAGCSAAVLIEGEAGIGKSRLIGYLIDEAQRHSLRCLVGAGDAIEYTSLYHAWRPIFAKLFDLDLPADDGSTEVRDGWRTRVLTHLRANLPDRLELAPLLNAVLPVDFTDNDLTRHMTGEVRANNTQELLAGLLAAVARAVPLVLVIEDAHWLDSASWALVRKVGREVSPALLAIATRPLPEPVPPEYDGLRSAPETCHLNLQSLPRAEIELLVAQRLGVDALPPAVADFIHAKAEGHPFFSEELAYALRDAGLILIEGHMCRVAPGSPNLSTLSFPDTIEGVITSRIDRLAPEHQLTVKVASIIGRLFGYRVLREIHPIDLEKRYLREHLDLLHRLDITPLETPEPDLTYIFKHVITQEVAYNLMTFSQRRELHRVVAQWYERTFAADLQPYYTLLAYHWRLAIGDPRQDAELVEQAIYYLEQAGQQALHGNANQEAAYYFSQAIALDTQRDAGSHRLQRARLYRQRGEAHYRLGQTHLSRADFEQALRCLGLPSSGSAGRMLASVLRQAGRQVLHRLRPAQMLGRASGEQAKLAMEAAQIHDSLTNLYFFAEKRLSFMHSILCALNFAETVGANDFMAANYGTLCVLMGNLSRYAWADGYARMALAAADQIDTPTMQGTAQLRIGVYYASIAQWAAGRVVTEQAIAHYARLNNHRAWGDACNLLELLLCFHGEYDESLRYCDELAASGERHENIQHVAWGLGAATRNLLKTGRFEETIARANQAIARHGDSILDTERSAVSASMMLAYFRTSRYRQALAIGDEILDWIEPRVPLIFAVQDIYADLAEMCLSAWELNMRGELAEAGQPVRPARALPVSAARACKALHKYAKVFPIGRPAAWLAQGMLEQLRGRSARAAAAWRKGLALAEQLDMPYELGRLHYEIGRHIAAGEPARGEHLRRAAAIFERLNARYDLELAREAIGLALAT